MTMIPTINQMTVSNGRTQKENDTVINLADLYDRQFNGETRINGKPSGTSFGADMVIAMEKAELSSKWDEGINLKSLVTDLQNGGYVKVTTDESTYEVGTSAAVNGIARSYSKKTLRYQPGIPAYAKFTAAFPTDAMSDGDYRVGIGMLSATDGFAIVQIRDTDVISYKFMIRHNSVDEYFDLNGDDISAIDLTNLTVMRFDYGFLGIDSTRLWIRDQVNNKWILAHKQLYDQRTTNLVSPNLPGTIFAENTGNTLNVFVLNGSFQLGTVDGGSGMDSSARSFNHSTIQTGAIAATRGLISAFRNPTTVTMYDSKDSTGATTTRDFVNTIASKLKEISISTDGSKNVLVELLITDISNIVSGTWASVDTGTSVIDYSSDAVITLTDAKLLDTLPLAKSAAITKAIIQDYLLLPGQVAVFVYTTASATDLITSIKFDDLF